MKVKKCSGMKRRVMSAALALTMTASLVPGASANGIPSPLPKNAYLGVTKLEAKAFNLTLEVTPTDVGTENIYASVIDFGQPGNPTLQMLDPTTLMSINPTTYLNPGAITPYPGINANHRSAWKVSGGNGAVTALDIGALGTNQFTIDELSTSYFHRYALVVFDGMHKAGILENYAPGYFQVDSKGNSDTWDESYMVRYMTNGNAYTGVTGQSVNGMPEYEITKDATAGTRKDTTLSAALPTSAGFTFKGWDSNKNLLGTTPNDAADSTANAQHAAGGTYTPVGVNANAIVDLYAIWQPVKPVLTAKTQTDKPAVGKKYEYTFDINGHTATSKTIAVQTGTLPAGLKLGAATFSNGTEKAVITGTPTAVKDTTTPITLRITDDINKSYVDVNVTIPAIEAGYQAEPAEDWNTGVEVVGVSAADAVDGKIVGFYAQTPGSEAIVYTNTERVYEYRMWKTGAPDFATATDEQKETDANWTKWRALDSTGAMADQSGEDEADRTPGYGMDTLVDPAVQTPNQATKLQVHDDVNDIDIMNSFAVEGLPKGNYQTRYAEKTTEPKYKASEPTNIAVTEGGAGGDSGAKIEFILGASAVIDDDATDSVDEAAKFAEFLGTLANVKKGDKVVIPPYIPTRDGNTFVGWTDGAKTEDGKAYVYYNYSATPDEPQSFITIGDSKIVLTPVWAADLTKLVTLSYYDWDGVKIGTSVFPKSDVSVAKVGEIITAFESTMKATTVDGFGYANDATKPLTNKAGYQFEGVWLNNSNSEFECYMLDDGTGYNSVPLNHQSKSNYLRANQVANTAIADGLTNNGEFGIRAAYLAQTNLNRFKASGSVATGEDVAYNYTMENVKYNRYGTTSQSTGQYSIQFDLVRKNVDGNPVSRSIAPAVHTITKSNTLSLVSRTEVGASSDVMHVELMPDKSMGTLTYKLLDTAKVPTWLTGRTQSLVVTSAKDGEAGFVFLGTLACVYNAAAKKAAGDDSNWGDITIQDFNTDLKMKVNGATLNPITFATAKKNIGDAVAEAIGKGNTTPFTFTQMQYAAEKGTIYVGETPVA